MSISLLPLPRFVTPTGTQFSLSPQWRIVCAGDDPRLLPCAEECRDRLQERCGMQLPIVSCADGPSIVLTFDPAQLDSAGLREAGWAGQALPAEGYTLTIGDTITLAGVDAAGLFYAVQTLAQLVSPQGTMPGVRIADYPVMPIRGFQFDIGRQVERMDHALEVCRRMARWKANTVFLYVENGVRYERHPGLAAPGAWPISEMREFIRQCAEWHMDVIPIVPNLGHTNYIIKHPDYAHLNEGRDGGLDSYGNTGHSLCPSLPETKRLVEDFFTEWFAVSPSPYFHISCDESAQLGLCSLCRPKYDQGGMQRIYLEHINWAAELAVQGGKRPMLWGEMMLYWPQAIPDMHPEMIVMDWEYETRAGRPLNAFMHWRREDTTGLFLQAGYDVVLAPAGYSSSNTQMVNAYGRQPGVLGINTVCWSLGSTYLEFMANNFAYGAAEGWMGYAPAPDVFERACAWARFGDDRVGVRDVVAAETAGTNWGIPGNLKSCITPLPADSMPALAGTLCNLERFESIQRIAPEAERERLECEVHLLKRERFSQRLQQVMTHWYQRLRHPERTPPGDVVADITALLADCRELQPVEAEMWARYRPSEQVSHVLKALQQLEGEMNTFLAHLQNGEPTGLETDYLILHLTETDPCLRKVTVEIFDGEEKLRVIGPFSVGGTKTMRMQTIPLPPGIPPTCTLRISTVPHGEIGLRFVEILYANGAQAVPATAEGSGFVRNPQYVLTDDMRPCWMNPDDVETTYLWHQHRPELMQPNVLTLEMTPAVEFCATVKSSSSS
ncbi:MAG: beta-N-acetylhexosaminidase [Armatimonadota bacterium]